MSESKVNSSQKYSIKELPCEKVVVYQDRAEVKRLIKTRLNKGENEIIISNVSNNVDQDSVRVEGKGEATVLDVVCQSKRITESEQNSVETNEKITKLKNEIKELETNQDLVELKANRVLKQINVLNDYATTLSKPPVSDKENESSNSKNIDNFMNFLDTYSSKLEVLDDLKYRLQKELNEIREKLSVARDNLNRLNLTGRYGVDSTEIVILVEGKKDDTEVYLFVSYLVSNASWIPKYDIRVFSKDKSMIINYYGMITQSTGEDWNDTKISLSTAVPSIGGNVPELETQNVRIKPKEVYLPRPKSYGGMKLKKSFAQRYDDFDEAELCSAPMASFAALPDVEVQRAQVEKPSIGSTSTFEIPRNATIPSDNNTHKVSIGIINLKPEFEYESVPRKNTHAFIKAKVVNESDYLILAGQASVFFENNFVSKTELKSYSPQEEFTCSLGIDAGIRIDYKPIKKFKGQTGILSKSINTTYIQTIEVKNTTSNSIKILIQDNIPLSNDDKIQVKLIEPQINKNTQNIRLNKLNNIEFDLVIPSGKTEELTIKYSIEHPADQQIELI